MTEFQQVAEKGVGEKVRLPKPTLQKLDKQDSINNQPEDVVSGGQGPQL